MKTDTFLQSIEESLRSTPDVVGRKLKPDRELAEMFQLSYTQVRYSLEQLAKRGILVRRRGSGTYVKTPLAQIRNQHFNTDSSQALATVDVFDRISHSNVMNDFVDKRHYQIGVWADLTQISRVNQRMTASVSTHASRLEHGVMLNSMMDETGARWSDAQLKRLLERSGCDGHLVAGHLAEHVKNVVEHRSEPVLFFTTGTHEMTSAIPFEPMLSLNTEKAAERGVMILAEAGYRRIGFLNQRPGNTFNEYTMGYKHGLARCKLDYRLKIMCNRGIDTEPIRAALTGPDRPDAIYVRDENALPSLIQVLESEGIEPGRDLGIVTVSNYSVPLPEGYNWSRLEFDPAYLGQRAVDKLVWQIEHPGRISPSETLYANWVPGQTHHRTA